MKYKRPLSARTAQSCEDAEYPVCTCRCRGALHGISHAKYIAVERGIYEEKKEVTEQDVDEIISYVLNTEEKD